MKKEKENLVEKSPFLKHIEKSEVMGIVNLSFEEEKAPLPNINQAKKPLLKPQDSEIKKEKTAKSEKKPKPIEEIPVKAESKIAHTEEIKIEDLEKEIKAKKRLLKLKREEERKRLELERLKIEEEERIKDEERKKLEEISQVPQEIPSEVEEVRLIPNEDKFLKVCPICNSQIKKGKVRQKGFLLTQSFKCKNKTCNFTKKLDLEI